MDDLFDPRPSRESTPEAPIVLDIDASYCNLSSTGNYLLIRNYEGQSINAMYDLRTNAEVVVPQQIADYIVHQETWLDDDILFVSTQNQAKPATFMFYPAYDPANGWLVDIKTMLVTDVLSLPPQEQALMLQTARERYEEDHQLNSSQTSAPSPNGQYFVSMTGFIFDRPNHTLNNPDYSLGWPSTCINGWKPDSSGVYFVTTSGRPHHYPGPIRFLPVTPP